MKKAIIVGAGPAGLTAAYELLQKTDILPIILEKSGDIGGISKTMDYKGNRMDMGPHRFFSKSDRVMEWWLHIMPLEDTATVGKQFTISYQNKSRSITQAAPARDGSDRRMVVIQRLTRIYFLRKFFAYPIQLSIDTLKTLGLWRTVRILLSFLKAKLFPRKAVSLEDFIINQFGKDLYLLFFKDYTEKVWGVPCHDISAEWGAQRIKGVSLGKAILQAVKSLRGNKGSDLSQKDTETSLIEQFLYPKYGPGSLWEEVARQVEAMGGKIYLRQQVQEIYSVDNTLCSVHTLDTGTGESRLFEGDYFFSSMPVQELVAGMGVKVPSNVREVAAGLQYRDFINVGVLLKRLSKPGKQPGEYEDLQLKDNWIYIQERDVKVGRLMIYNNWGGGMIKDPNTVWIGMEYFCNKTDDFWALDDRTIEQHAIMELEKMELATVGDVLDTTVRRMEKTYPAYFGTYDRFGEIRAFIDRYENLFLIGRNGMHKYNNADHSMLTAMVSVDNICAGITSKENIWAINTEQEYHEEKSASGSPKDAKARKLPAPSFVQYLWHNKWNRAYCILAGISFIAQFILFKLHYPFANYMPDSYSYLDAAYSNADVNMWPVAYSKFLRLFSVFTHSDKVLVGFQYLYMQAGALFLLFSLLYLVRPGRLVRNVLVLFFLFDPVPLYMANYISADALFIGTSFCWFTTLIWVIYKPRKGMMVLHALSLLGCFVLRYNAIYYPILSALAFVISSQAWKAKLIGIATGWALVVFSFLYTTQKMADITGARQFSAFGGWQMANNALYMYEHIPARARVPIPARFVGLDKMVRQHMDTLGKVKLSHDDSVNNYFYLWSARGPLHQYLERQWKKDSTTPYFKRWASEAPLYMHYALFLIHTYPGAFLEHFMAPNAVKFAVPPTEFLGIYNMGGDSVRPIAKSWFHYKTQQVQARHGKKAPISLVDWFSIFSALANLLLLLHLVGLLCFGQFRRWNNPTKLFFLTACFWVLNAGFSIFASPIVMRYQLFPVLLSFSMALIAGQFIYSPASSEKSEVI